MHTLPLSCEKVDTDSRKLWRKLGRVFREMSLATLKLLKNMTPLLSKHELLSLVVINH